MSRYRIDTARILFVVDPQASFWTRDVMFFVKDAGKMKVVYFDFNGYGVYPYLVNEPVPERIKYHGLQDERVARFLNLPAIKSTFVFEGGGIESNGKGTLMAIKEMALQRNPTKSLVQIEAELKRTLGAKKVIWLKDGLIEDKEFKNRGPFYKNLFGGGANMHIDELCRFVNETTVVLPYISKEDRDNNPVDSINYYMLEENYRLLQKAKTWDGKNISVVRIPMPEALSMKESISLDSTNYKRYEEFGFAKGDTVSYIPAASYCNFLISNNVVLISKYWKRGMSESQRKKDKECLDTFQKLFSNRKVIGIYTLGVNRGGGGINCMTHEQPALTK